MSENNVNYANVPDHLLAGQLGTSAAKWAAAFQQIVVDKDVEIDEDLMIGWFANAIETAKS